MGPPPDLFAELSRWKAKAIQRGKVTHFNSDIIPDWLNAEVVAAQEAVGVEGAFSFLKQTPLDVRMAAERRIKRKVQAILKERQAQAARAIEQGEQFDYEGLAEELRAAVQPELSALMVDNALRLSVEVGIGFDPAIINTEALRWAREYSYDLVRGLTDTTRRQLQEAVTSFVQTPGMTIGDIESLIEPAFGPVRAEMIAVTETTRAYSMATNEMQGLLQREMPELAVTKVWNTMNDELVCFPAWTMVDTDKGQRPIQRIRPGEYVRTRTGYRRVMAAGKREYSGQMVRVETDRQSVIATANHPFWTLEQGWLQGRDLKVGHTLQLANDEAAKVCRVLNFAFGDTAYLPTVLLKVARLASIAGLVLMPVFAIDFQGYTGSRQQKVNRVSAHSGLLGVVKPKGIKDLPDALFKQRFTLKGAIARKATELPVGGTGLNAEPLAAIATVDEHGRAAAFFRTIARLPARFAGLKLFAAPLTDVRGQERNATFPTAMGEPIRNSGPNLKGLSAGRADLRDYVGGPDSIVALAATIAAPLCNLPLVLVGQLAARWAGNHLPLFGEGVVTGIRAEGMHALGWTVTLKGFAALVTDKLKGHTARLLTELGLLYHRLLGTSSTVYNLQVEGPPEFYANGILVHNCEICGPLEGAPESVWSGQFPSGPPAHPRCRCESGISFLTPEQMAAEFAERQAEREAWLRSEGLIQ